MPAERTRNGLLQRLEDSDHKAFARLFDELEPLALERSFVLGPARLPAEWVYFVESGIVSMIASTTGGQSVEVAVVGREGAAGVADALGGEALPYQFVVQIPGMAYRAPRQVVREHILSCSTLHTLLMSYAQHVVHQLAQSAICNRFHTSHQRLARWLLLTAERADANRFELTHDFVAQMVGAPRSAVSGAAALLREKGIIDYQRGVLSIRNPKRLRAMACECFDAVSWARHLQGTPPQRRAVTSRR
jgi:CRP-like cAMP-binding protein